MGGVYLGHHEDASAYERPDIDPKTKQWLDRGVMRAPYDDYEHALNTEHNDSALVCDVGMLYFLREAGGDSDAQYQEGCFHRCNNLVEKRRALAHPETERMYAN